MREECCKPPVVVLMGVSGSGKSVVGRALSRMTECPFCDSDDLHPTANVDKMRRGEALTDKDRAPWLDRVGAWIAQRTADGRGGVVACSALKRTYRDALRASAMPAPVFTLLDPDRATLKHRLARRQGHFMPAQLLASQLETLETLGDDETGLRVRVQSSDSPESLAMTIADWLAKLQSTSDRRSGR